MQPAISRLHLGHISANRYDSLATVSNASACKLAEVCLNPRSKNAATVTGLRQRFTELGGDAATLSVADCGKRCCHIGGCTDSFAANFDPAATYDDRSCIRRDIAEI